MGRHPASSRGLGHGVPVPRGLDELALVVSAFKTRFNSQCCLCFVAACFWPILLFVMPFFFFFGSAALEKVLLVLAVAVLSACYFAGPAAVLVMQGPQHYVQMVHDGQIELVEIASFCVCFVILLVLVCFAWVLFETLSLEVALSLQSRSQFLASYWKEPLEMTEAERKKVFSSRAEENFYIDDLLRHVAQFPGWRGHFSFDERAIQKVTQERGDRVSERSESVAASPEPSARGSRKETPRSRERAGSVAGAVAELDKIVLTAEHTGLHASDVSAITHKIAMFFRWLLVNPSISRADFVMLLMVGFVRASIPRVWVFYYHGAPLVPSHPVDAVFVFMLWFGTFLVASMCFILLESTRVDYAHNVEQMMLVSALASVEQRHAYLTDVVQVDYSTEEGRRTAETFPLLDVSKPANLRIWWAMREFAIVDSMDERTALEVVLSMALMYQFAIVTYSITELFVAGGVTAFTAVVLFDLTVIGGLVMLATLSCVQVNGILSSHQSALLCSRQHIWSPESKITGLSVAEQYEFVEGTLEVDEENFDNALLLHNHLIEKVRHADNLQKLFGIEVTTDNVVQLAVAIGCGVAASARYFT